MNIEKRKSLLIPIFHLTTKNIISYYMEHKFNNRRFFEKELKIMIGPIVKYFKTYKDRHKQWPTYSLHTTEPQFNAL